MAEITQPASGRTRPPGLYLTCYVCVRDMHLGARETVEKTLASDEDEAPPAQLSVFWFQVEIDNFNPVPCLHSITHTHARSHTHSHTRSDYSRSEKKEGEMSAFVGGMRFHTQPNGSPLRVTSRGAETCKRRFVTRPVLQVRFCNGMAFSESQCYL